MPSPHQTTHIHCIQPHTWNSVQLVRTIMHRNRSTAQRPDEKHISRQNEWPTLTRRGAHTNTHTPTDTWVEWNEWEIEEGRCVPSADPSSSLPSSSSEQMLKMLTSISVTTTQTHTIYSESHCSTLHGRQHVRRWRTFFANKGQWPGEDVHEVWQPVRMGRAIKLSYVHHIVFVFQYGSWLCENEKKREKQINKDTVGVEMQSAECNKPLLLYTSR